VLVTVSTLTSSLHTPTAPTHKAFALPFVGGTNPCENEGGAVCGIVRHLTSNPDLAGTLKTVIGGGGRILAIVIIAIIARALLHRVVTRIVERSAAVPSLSPAIPGAVRHWRHRESPENAVSVSVVSPERRQQRGETIGSLLRNAVTVTVGTIAFVEILGTLGLNLAPIVASAGIVGVALGFGAQNVVKDFLSGIFMILEDQYGVGDVIDLGVGEANGTVEAVGLRITRLRDIKGQVWHVRNGEVVRVANKSQGWSRAVLDVPVAYGHDVDHASAVIKRVADELWLDPDYAGKVLAEPDVLGVQDLGADAVTIRLSVKTEPLAQWEIARQLRARIKAAFDAEGIEIPNKQHSIWVRSDDAGSNGDGSNGNGSGPSSTTASSRPTRRASATKNGSAGKKAAAQRPAKRTAAKS
jgi:small-conductance mechanosensitive channel